jgi:hypothetical protein
MTAKFVHRQRRIRVFPSKNTPTNFNRFPFQLYRLSMATLRRYAGSKVDHGPQCFRVFGPEDAALNVEGCSSNFSAST